MKIVSIVGKKNTGKTSLTVKVIEELTKRGYNVASIKHSHHTMEMDRENTDTWKHKNAGSNVVVGIGSTTFFNVRKEMDLNRLLFLIKHMDNVDFVVIEGFKRYNYPKIATSPDVVDEYTIKQVDSFTIDYEGLTELVDLIEERSHDIVDTLFANNCGYNDGEAIACDIRNGNITVDNLDGVHSYLSIDGKVVGLNRFVSDYLKQSVLGVINTLNLKDYNVEDIQDIELIIPGKSHLTPTDANCSIQINGKDLEINAFTKNIVSNSINGMIRSLKTESDVKTIEIVISNIEHDQLENASIELKTNNHSVEINEFTQGILKETTYAIVNSLKIDDEIKELKINVGE
ncbi:MAG: molybdopterin-guanine dinucleotide biosynthesis protein B [Methanobrevibacter sp.]|uniref:molybdopterin-guanine dinucleotide biosynthesis protein B n=1 Tax=Methanobrevibacter TaxID=2172 RepID=UPI0025EC1E97|nr:MULTISPECIES: molybdopterin-guanine dinucleotide biosynthesis protein B [Methanobrevibacter]MBS7258432.1 molybdopterin-guanine dinucleotide biosynthesis protein B [Methanobrevibacter sp.]MDY3097811.1 molybdopterin-guanine dinucleotide biosynthesis protein B [Methanobrevibacter sp.]